MMKITEKILENHPEILGNINLNGNYEISYVYLAGSLFEGFGNEMSDIDVYVIYKGILAEAPYDKNSSLLQKEEGLLVNNIIVNGLRYDYEYWSLERFENAAKIINNLDCSTESYLPRISDSDYDLLHRLKFAKPIYNEEGFWEFYNSINFNNLKYYSAVIRSERYSGYIEDVQGAMLSGDLKSAFIMSRILIEEVVTGYLAIHGETNPSRKWLYRKFDKYVEKSGDIETYNEYFRLITEPQGFNEADLNAYIRSVIQFCQRINLACQNELLEYQKNKGK